MHRRKKGFTFAELIVSSFVAMLVFMCATAIYIMGWQWWNEIAPRTECERMARIALSVISEGMTDAALGNDVVDFINYGRRGGLEASIRNRADSLAGYAGPAIANDGHSISFKLEPDPVASNIRTFFLGQDASGFPALCYRVGNNAAQVVRGTVGRAAPGARITSLDFAEIALPVGNSNRLIRVTVTAQATIGTGPAVRNINVTYDDYIFFRNV